MLGIAGSVASSSLALILPGAVYLKILPNSPLRYRAFAIACIALGILAAAAGLVQTIIGMVQSSNSDMIDANGNSTLMSTTTHQPTSTLLPATTSTSRSASTVTQMPSSTSAIASNQTAL